MGKSSGESHFSFLQFSTRHRMAMVAVAIIALLWSTSMRGGRGMPSHNPQAAAAPVSPISHISSFLQPARQLSATISGPSENAEALGGGQGKPLTLATEDFNGDGWPDLVAGYAALSGEG